MATITGAQLAIAHDHGKKTARAVVKGTATSRRWSSA